MPSTSYSLRRLRDGIKPFKLHWFPTLRSTNDHSAELRRRGDLYAPAIVLTGRQTAGRGRGANRWWSGAGVLTATFLYWLEDSSPVSAYVRPSSRSAGSLKYTRFPSASEIRTA